MKKYFLNCFLLLLPVLAWNLLFAGMLPASFAPDFFWKDIPALIRYPENILRSIVLILPLVMPLVLKTRLQKTGFFLYLAGLVIYFLSWVMEMRFPGSGYSKSLAGFMAPAYTPITWLTGIGLIGSPAFIKVRHFRGIYIGTAALFVLFHSIHTYLVFQRL